MSDQQDQGNHQQQDWSPAMATDMPAERGRAFPIWIWGCGGGCLLTLVLVFGALFWIGNKVYSRIGPEAAWPRVAELGLGGIYVSEEWGGSGLSRRDATLVFEALAMACPASTLLPVKTTPAAPAAMNPSTVALPIPLVPPVINATFPASFVSMQIASYSSDVVHPATKPRGFGAGIGWHFRLCKGHIKSKHA